MRKSSNSFISYCICLFLFLLSATAFAQKNNSKKVWIISELLESGENISVLGNPEKINSPYGTAVQFDGIDDAIQINEMPLKGLSEFTIEMLIYNRNVDTV